MSTQGIFVLGPGRSGTSAITRVLSLCGCALPRKLMAANGANPRGFWEPLDALDLNNEFLARHDVGWGNPTLRLQEEGISDPGEREDFVGRIRAFLRECPRAPALVIKDPRITILSEFWWEAARREALATVAVIPVRHPQEVAASWAATLGVSPALANAVWLKYNLLAERCSRDLPRVFVAYADLLGDWRMQIGRVAEALDIDLQTSGDAGREIDAFLTRDLYRQRFAGSASDSFGQPWTSQAFDIFSAAARGRPVDVSALDAIYDSYRTCERAFRTSMDEFRSKTGAAPGARL
jgi:hypothetical protein